MGTRTVTISLGVDYQDPAVQEFRVYGSLDPLKKGELLATVEAAERTVVFEVEEGEWTFRVLYFTKGGAEEPWEACKGVSRHFVSGRGEETAAPVEPAILPTEPNTQASVAVDPVASSEEPTVAQVVEGPDEYRGKLVAEVNVPAAGPRVEGARVARAAIPLDGSGQGGTRSLVVASRSRDGRRGTAGTAQSVIVPERFGFEGILVCSIDAAAGTSSGMTAPDDAEGAAIDAPYGYHTERWPQVSNAGACAVLDSVDSGYRFGRPLTPYPDRLKVTSTEKDLGSSLDFVLECYDQVQRMSLGGLLTTKPVWAMCRHPAVPSVNRDLRHEDEEGPAWLTRDLLADGKCRQPIRRWRWQYIVGASSTGSPSESDWKPYVPGAWLRGRYLWVRLIVEDAQGYHGLKTGDVAVYARVPIVTRQGSGSPEASVAAPPRSFYQRTSDNTLWMKLTGHGNTGWAAVAGAAPAESAVTFTDITTNNVTSTKHGYAPKSPGNARKYLDGSATPAYTNVQGALIQAPTRYTSGTGTHTPQTGCTLMRVTLYGGGGGGGGVSTAASQASGAGGGGGGGKVVKEYASPSAMNYSVGAGGAGGAAGNNSGAAGGDTTFDTGGTVITAKGGSGGSGQASATGSAVAAGGAGGAIGTNGTVNGAGAPGGWGGHFGVGQGMGGAGGSGEFGGGGLSTVSTSGVSTAGTNGAGPGAGGSGASSSNIAATDRAGGDGAAGLIVVEEFF